MAFCAVSDQEIKLKIRKTAEREEYTNYHGRMSDAWLEDLKPLGTDWEKHGFNRCTMAYRRFQTYL